MAEPPLFLSLSQVNRELKKEAHSAFSCLASIFDDAAFVSEIALCYPELPLLANLRCGSWYTQQKHAGTCYFKSTDGHFGNWTFSTTRLNWHVAALSAEHGGCIIVDATRKGKRFPVSTILPASAPPGSWEAGTGSAVKVLAPHQCVHARRTHSPRPSPYGQR
jgi:hypothetical protein